MQHITKAGLICYWQQKQEKINYAVIPGAFIYRIKPKAMPPLKSN